MFSLIIHAHDVTPRYACSKDQVYLCFDLETAIHKAAQYLVGRYGEDDNMCIAGTRFELNSYIAANQLFENDDTSTHDHLLNKALTDLLNQKYPMDIPFTIGCDKGVIKIETVFAPTATNPIECVGNNLGHDYEL